MTTDTASGNAGIAERRPTAQIEIIAARHGLPPSIVVAICKTESGLNPWAMRCEPAYRWLWDVNRSEPFTLTQFERADARLPPKRFPQISGISQLTEWTGQQSSWGLMQVMGALARQLGFRGHFPMICDPAIGVDLGCQHLVALRDRFLKQFGWPGVIAAYNAGTPRLNPRGAGFVNQDYVDLVIGNGAKFP